MDEVDPPQAVPGSEVWRRLGLTLDSELHDGYQSRVFLAHRGSEALVVKLIDERHADTATAARIEMTAGLATADTQVVGPVPIDGALVTRLDGWLAFAYPHVSGHRPDLTDRADVTAMAAGLARLHRSLRTLTAPSIPPVSSLRGVDLDAHGFGRVQLLHGDFSDANVLIGDHGLHIIDFDDCGYGPIEFEIGNTLYMVLFDASLRDRLTEYERFRSWFIAGYEEASVTTLDTAAIDASIQLRTRALKSWLDDLSSAPAGVRNSSAEWRAQLRSFVDGRGGIYVRDFRIPDQGAFRSLVLAGLQERWGDDFHAAQNPDLDDITATYTAPGTSVVVAEHGGRLVGTGILVRESATEARIVRMSVAADHRRRGVGRLVVESLLDRATSIGVERVLVSTDTPWFSAIALYRSCGFIEVGSDDTDTHFVKRLGSP